MGEQRLAELLAEFLQLHPNLTEALINQQGFSSSISLIHKDEGSADSYNGSNINTTGINQISNYSTTAEDNSLISSKEARTDFYIGLALACSSCLFIGSSFIFKKKGLLNLAHRAGDGGYGYLREPWWWAGLILMAVGEAANFTAYTFAPASLVTPLGALSVIVSAILASHLLKERLSFIGKIGCGLCVLGSMMIILNAPEQTAIYNMDQLALKFIDPGFVIYVCLIAILCLVLMCHYAPRIGRQNCLIYILICSGVGSLTVMGCKGTGLAIVQTIQGDNMFVHWLSYCFIFLLLFCISIQMIYLNKALDAFNTAVVTPIYYVCFTVFVIVASSILYKEWATISASQLLGNVVGFATIICGIFLLNAFRDLPITFKDAFTSGIRAEHYEQEMETLLPSHWNKLNKPIY